MGQLVFFIIHLTVFFVAFPLLIITVPLHMIYNRMGGK